MVGDVRGDFRKRIADCRRHDHRFHRQAIGFGELPVALVVRGHRHHRAGAVAHQHEVGDVDRHVLAGERMDRPVAGGHAALVLGLQLGLGYAALPQFGQKRGQFGIRFGGLQRQRMLASHADEGHAHQGVRACGVDDKLPERGRHIIAVHAELDLKPFAAADPVALHGLDRLRPARQGVQTVQQFLRIRGDLEEPLRDFALLDDGARTPAAAVDDLLIGQHGLIDRVPIDHRIFAIHQAFLHQPGEHALFVDVVIRAAGGEFARPVDRVAQRLQLAAHVVDVGVGPLRRCGLVLDRGVLGRQPEGIPTHRLQHVVSGHAPEPADHIADRVIAHVAHMQRARRVRQHRQAEVFRLVGTLINLERARVAPVGLGSGFGGSWRILSGLSLDGLDGHGGKSSLWAGPSSLPQRTIHRQKIGR